MTNVNSLLLMDDGLAIGLIAGIAVVVGIICFLVGKIVTDRIRTAKFKSTEKEIAKMKEEAEQECKAIKKEAILEAKEQDLKLRNEFERETKEKRIEFQKMEQRLAQKDDVLNKRDANLLKKNEELEQQKRELDRKSQSIAAKQEKIDKEYESVIAKLEEISGLTKEEAKKTTLREYFRRGKTRRSDSSQKSRTRSERRGGQKSERHYKSCDTEMLYRPCVGNNRFGGSASQRRYESAYNRSRG